MTPQELEDMLLNTVCPLEPDEIEMVALCVHYYNYGWMKGMECYQNSLEAMKRQAAGLAANESKELH